MFLGVSDTAFSVFSLLFNLPILHKLLMFSPILVCPDFVYPDFYAARIVLALLGRFSPSTQRFGLGLFSKFCCLWEYFVFFPVILAFTTEKGKVLKHATNIPTKDLCVFYSDPQVPFIIIVHFI